MGEELARRAWLLPAASGVVGGIDVSLLDPAVEDDRHVLFLAEHPDLGQAIDNGEEEFEVDGAPMSPRLHLAMHEVVANQIWNDDPPEVWSTAQRLTHLGYDRHEVLRMLASVVSADVYNALSGKAAFDIARMRRELAALPESWETMRAPGLPNREARRAHARKRYR